MQIVSRRSFTRVAELRRAFRPAVVRFFTAVKIARGRGFPHDFSSFP